MDTMEVTKLVGAVCGSLLVFLLIQTAAHAIYNTESEAVGYAIEVPEGAEGGEPAEEQVDVAALMSAADPAKGETVFKKCAACHKLDGANAVGPHLDAPTREGMARPDHDLSGGVGHRFHRGTHAGAGERSIAACERLVEDAHARAGHRRAALIDDR